MTNDPNSWRERLLAAEPETPALRAEYDRRLKAMFETPLSRTRRASLIAVLVAAVGMLVLFAALLLTERNLKWPARAAFGGGIVVTLAWAAYAARVLRRGAYNRRSDATLAAGLAWAVTLIAAVLFAAMTPRPDPFTAFCFLFLLPAAVLMLRTVTEQSELRTREHLLAVEYKLARLGEALAPAAPPDRPAPAGDRPARL